MASERGNLQASIMLKKVMVDLPKILKIFAVNKVMELVKTPVPSRLIQVGGALLVVGVIVTVRYIVKYPNTPRYVASASGGNCLVFIRENDVVGAISNNPDEVREVCSTVAGPSVVDGLQQVLDTFLTAYIRNTRNGGNCIAVIRNTRNGGNCIAVKGRRGRWEVEEGYTVLFQTATFAFSRGDFLIMGSQSFWELVDYNEVVELASNCRLERAAKEMMCLAIAPGETFNSHVQQDLFLIAFGSDIDVNEDIAVGVIYML